MENICPFFHFGGIYQQMHELDDHDLLRQYAEQNSEAAFAALVAHHVDKVYSAALRHTRNAHAAEEITQAVFVILARKAGGLGRKVIVAGWLYETARLTALTYIRSEIRRSHREQEAHMQTALNENDDEAWPHIAPLLDDALAGLNKADRDAVVLRYFDGKSLGEVGASLGVSEDAAKKRVTRAVEKLRGFFTKRGMTLTATVLTAAISANSVQAAPLGLAATVAATAAKGAVVSGSCLGLIQGALKIMAWTKVKTASWIAASLLLVTGVGALVWSADPRELGKNPRAFIFRPTQFTNDTAMQMAWGQSAEPTRYMAKNMELSKIVAFAYHARPSRMKLPPDFPLGSFDVMLTQANHEKDMSEILQNELKERFGLIAHYETNTADILELIVVKSPASGLKIASDGKTSQKISDNQIILRNQYWYRFCAALENQLGRPIADNDALSKAGVRYNIDFSWQLSPNEAKEKAIKDALLNQLGLELVHTNSQIKMLVVEKVE